MDKIDSSLFNSILEGIEPNNDPVYVISDIAFDKIDILVERHWEDDFCQLLINSIELNTDLRKVAIILDVLIWSTPDNGTIIDRLTNDWLKSDDLVSIKCILFRQEWLPNRISWKTDSTKILTLYPKLEPILNYYDEELIYSSQTGFRRIKELNAAINEYQLSDKPRSL